MRKPLTYLAYGLIGIGATICCAVALIAMIAGIKSYGPGSIHLFGSFLGGTIFIAFGSMLMNEIRMRKRP